MASRKCPAAFDRALQRDLGDNRGRPLSQSPSVSRRRPSGRAAFTRRFAAGLTVREGHLWDDLGAALSCRASGLATPLETPPTTLALLAEAEGGREAARLEDRGREAVAAAGGSGGMKRSQAQKLHRPKCGSIARTAPSVIARSAPRRSAAATT
jgi:hypothetical protein